jgi:hypothetical protein
VNSSDSDLDHLARQTHIPLRSNSEQFLLCCFCIAIVSGQQREVLSVLMQMVERFWFD